MEREAQNTERQENDAMTEERSEMEREKGGRKRGRQRSSGRLSGSMAAKTVAFFVFVAGIMTAIAGLILCLYMLENSFYSSGRKTAMEEALYQNGMTEIKTVAGYIEKGDLAGAKAHCENKNVEVDLWWYREKNEETLLIWSSGEVDAANCAVVTRYSPFAQLDKTVTLNGHTLWAGQYYIMNAYIDLSFPKEDDLSQIGRVLTALYDARYDVIGVVVAALLISILCVIFLMCSAGHRNGREGIVPGVLTGLHLDVLTGIFGFGGVLILYAAEEIIYHRSELMTAAILLMGGTVLAAWILIYFMDIAIRFKQGHMLRHTLVYVLLRAAGRCIRWIFTNVPMVFTTVAFFVAVCLLEFMGGVYYTRNENWILLWMVEKVILFVVILYVASTCKKLLKAGRAFADGKEDYKVDTSKMFGEFKEHGENLNSMGEGVKKAVAERMKSEHLKTELITNVSHDIKTPLTSIINYADLICEEKSENANINEYAEVLLRQSRRLRKLLDDLMEVAKATTGNIDVNLQPCEVGVLLTQAVGEYQQKMEEKQLALIARQPEEPVKIMADGRHLWRVFDNLLNNICKYAQENSRVYLSVETDEKQAYIIFRNMSKYALEVSPEELQERFVRGDKSRHMEGNGLGLSIAKSLIDLQNGRMDIVMDGDLFKVTLTFGLL